MTSPMMQVRLVANIHGNEAAGREILMQMGEHLLRGHGKVIILNCNLDPLVPIGISLLNIVEKISSHLSELRTGQCSDRIQNISINKDTFISFLKYIKCLKTCFKYPEYCYVFMFNNIKNSMFFFVSLLFLLIYTTRIPASLTPSVVRSPGSPAWWTTLTSLCCQASTLTAGTGPQRASYH